jgi:hypothetical protein
MTLFDANVGVVLELICCTKDVFALFTVDACQTLQRDADLKGI